MAKVNFNIVNTPMIALAREARGLYQHELAQYIDVSSATLSKIETGELGVSQELITIIAQVLKFPLDFFYQSGETVEPNLSYRKRDKVAQKLLSPIEAWVNIYRLNIQQLFKACSFEPAKIPHLDISVYGSPQAVANKLRSLWKVERGAIDNMVELLESHHIPVVSFHFNTERVDGRSILTETMQPIIFINRMSLGDRQRFTLAYELGHLVMHLFAAPDFERDVRHEANLFAAEFLMPEKDIKSDLKQSKLTLTRLAELKRKWKVSMQAVLYRADDLGIITDNQKRYTLEQFNAMKIRKREPQELDVPKEHATLIRNLMTKYKSAQKNNINEIAAFFHLSEEEFVLRYT
ncbi:MAG: hypothetical protein RIQ33_532 [Bacteroidota bacterium]|jgi:Zn-dependent peptidase ImmA (M78 family)/DNA-binding XRE family transcriptional regulator